MSMTRILEHFGAHSNSMEAQTIDIATRKRFGTDFFIIKEDYKGIDSIRKRTT